MNCYLKSRKDVESGHGAQKISCSLIKQSEGIAKGGKFV